ncbi:CBS domain-containing protein CBSX5-like [Solanum lycopersicum]|nr:CBS domain-containing protein CBSX5-like [Solanum lycopersicum]
MAVRFLNRDVSDLCLGKPALRSIPENATVAEALLLLKRSGETHLSLWNCDHSSSVLEKAKADYDGCHCVGKISMVDLICFLSKQEHLIDFSKAFEVPISKILPKGDSIVRHLDPNSSLLEAIDYMIEGTQNAVIPIYNNGSTDSRRKSSSPRSTNHNGVEYCWLTQEDVARFLLNSIGVFSPMPTFSIESLNIIDHNIMTIGYHDPAISALDSITLANIEQTALAVVDNDNKLIGEISASTLAYCDEDVAAAITTLSAGDLMAYIDYGGPPEDLVGLVKMRLQEKKLDRMTKLIMEEEFSASSSSSSACSCSSDDESGSSRNGSGRFSSSRRSEAITCYPGSSLVAVLIQALAHRATSVWVIDEDQNLVGAVSFKGILKVFRSIAIARLKPETENLSTQE